MNDVATSRDGTQIAYEVNGAGAPALIFIHGWSCDRSYWAEQMPEFAQRYRVVAIDLAGHGASGSGRASWTMPAFGADVAAVVEHLALEDVVLIGHSMGGDVIVEAALILGGRVKALVWVDVYRSLGERADPEEVERFIDRFRPDFVSEATKLVHSFFLPTTDPMLVDRIATDMAEAPPEAALDALRHAISNEGPVMDTLVRLTVPTVAINPDHKPTDREALERYGVRPVLLSGVGHFPMIEDPEQFNEALQAAIDGFA